MTIQPENAENPFVATYSSFPPEGQEMIDTLAYNYQRTAMAINSKEIAIYSTFETVTGQQWPPIASLTGIPTASTMTFRVIVPIPALAVGANLIAHNIQGINTQYVFTKLFGAIGNGLIWHSLPNNDIHLAIDATNLIVTIPVAYVGFTGFGIAEYLKTTV